MTDDLEYEVHLHPPEYPRRCFPFRCQHDPKYVMQFDVHIVQARCGNSIEIDHSVCLACGKALPSTFGGNVLVDLTMLWHRFGFHAVIGARVLHLRSRWARIATYLFNQSGWNGRHKRIATLIDPNLSMKLFLEPVEGADVRMGKIKFDDAYLRPDQTDE